MTWVPAQKVPWEAVGGKVEVTVFWAYGPLGT